MAEYRIDELARLAGATVRNIRVYQDRGLLPPPRRDGRVGIYTDAHLARLRLIGQLLKRGYTFATIGELLSVWERGGDVAEILDLESAVGLPWSDEIPAYVTTARLTEMFGAEATPGNIARSVELGLLEPDGAQVPGAEPAAAERRRRVGRGGDAAAGRARPGRTAAGPRRRGRPRPGRHGDPVRARRPAARTACCRARTSRRWPTITRRIRPLAQTAVDAMLAQAMSQHVPEALGDHFARVLDHLERDRSASAG